MYSINIITIYNYIYKCNYKYNDFARRWRRLSCCPGAADGGEAEPGHLRRHEGGGTADRGHTERPHPQKSDLIDL